VFYSYENIIKSYHFFSHEINRMAQTIIVGAGIAGLTVANELAKKGEKVLLLEKYNALGGRIATYRDSERKLQYEIGAGRIHKDHKRVHALIKKYKLHTYGISMEGSLYKTEKSFLVPNRFPLMFEAVANQLLKLPKKVLETHTISELMKDFPIAFRQMLMKYPYYSEIHTMRADLALETFIGRGTMRSDGPDDYVGIVEGIDSLTTKLAEECEKNGVVIMRRHKVSNIIPVSENLYTIVGKSGKKDETVDFEYVCNRVIVATCRCTAGDFAGLKEIGVFEKLATEPLVRIYAVYPKESNGKVWFAGMNKVATDNELRYVIPINDKSGLIMISYTDGKDTDVWRKLEKDEKGLQTKINQCVYDLFGVKTKPTFLKAHVWPSGCTYWKPGYYDPTEESIKSLIPLKKFPNLHLVGESYSTNQAWIEGALEQAEKLLLKLKQ
jgi:protoporphyrinogen oxidase